MIRRIAAAVLLVALAIALLLAAWPQLFGMQRLPLVAHVVSFRALAALTAIGIIMLLAVLLLLSRGFRRFGASLGALLIVFVLINAAVLSTRGFGGAEFEEKTADDLTVLSWNTLGPATTPEAVAALALEHDADIVVMPETIVENAEQVALAMKAGGHPMWVHTLSYDRISPAKSTSLLTSVELGDYDFDSVSETTHVLPSVVATPRDGSGPTIVAVHAVAPIPGQFSNWPGDLELLAELCDGENIIMAGDFNATIDHMSGLGASPGKTLGECTDSTIASNSAAVGTWPTALPALLGSPIDHVMATDDWTVIGARVIDTLDENGSDHRPVVAQLRKNQGD